MSEQQTSAPQQHRREPFLADDRLPWLMLPLLMLGFWVTESWLHTTFFDSRTFIDDLWPDGHELWMRVLVGACLFFLTILWSQAVKQRNARIRELSESQARLTELSRELAYGDSEERRELADRMHEQVGQSLSAARMFLSGVEAATEADAERLVSASSILSEEITAVREIANELSPPSMDEYGLWAPLESLCDRVMRRTGTSVECGTECEAPLTREVMLATFRALADVIEVAAVDAATGKVRVSGECSTSELAMTVAWHASEAPDLFAPLHLVRGVGGDLGVYTDVNGTRVVVTVPLA